MSESANFLPIETRKPIKWFGTTSCHWCGHMRKEHDGVCMGWQRKGGCNCNSFAETTPDRQEARRRFLGGESVFG